MHCRSTTDNIQRLDFMAKTPKPATMVRLDDLLNAETTLKKLSDIMESECKEGMSKWPREWMQKHVNERAAVIAVRHILIERAEAETKKPCRDQGGGFWDCSPRNACVNPQCADCPQMAADVEQKEQ